MRADVNRYARWHILMSSHSNRNALDIPSVVNPSAHAAEGQGMLFGRRKPPSLAQRIRTAFWPPKGISRSVRYIAIRVFRLKATPHAVAAGVAAGVAVSCTPFLGFHFIMAFCLAFILRGNMVAAALGTAFGNPLTFPLIFAAAYRIGVYLLGGQPSDRVGEANLFFLLRQLDFGPLWDPVLKPTLIGGLPLAALCGAAFYVLTRQGVRLFQQHGKRRTVRNPERRYRNILETKADAQPSVPIDPAR